MGLGTQSVTSFAVGGFEPVDKGHQDWRILNQRGSAVHCVLGRHASGIAQGGDLRQNSEFQ